jgi:hypothetical protein
MATAKRQLQRQRCKLLPTYNATGSLARIENKSIFFYFEKSIEYNWI